MKRCYFVLLALVLCLTGCANTDGDLGDSTPPETLPSGYYTPSSEWETKTEGAVLGYGLPDSGYQWIGMAGDRLMLASDTEVPRLMLLSGKDGVKVAELELENTKLETCQVFPNGFAYYDPDTKEAVFLDLQLQRTGTVSLPEELIGTPVFAEDGSQVFFCVGNELRSIEVERKLNRLIKSSTAGKMEIQASYFNGKVLACTVEYEDKTKETVYISSENGQTLKTDDHILMLYSSADSYFATRMDGTVLQRIVGSLKEGPKRLTVTDETVIGVPEMGGVVGCTAAENGLVLNYYDMTTGKKIAGVSVPDTQEPEMIIGDKWSKCIWLLIPGEEGNTLLRWDIKASAEQDENVYVDTLYTGENPDTVSLELINERVSALNKKYGVRIRVWEEAVRAPGEHILVPEHQVSVINEMLDQLESVLKEFPKKFISKSISSKVRICLVRSVDGEIKGQQYWEGKYALIAIAAGADVRSEFLKGFGHVVDSHVLGNSPMYDYWDDLNPDGFVYGGAINEALATGENRAFYDAESMQTGTIDRSRIFWQAMLPENADTFASETMQAKLKMLCKAIRDAWRLEREEEEYPWEQYLEKSIAYKKKR